MGFFFFSMQKFQNAQNSNIKSIGNMMWVSAIIEGLQVETLKNLGLSSLQSRIYLNLARLGTVEIKKVAASANVARQDIYRVMASLETLGLVEKVIAPTTLYRALPIRDGLSLMLEKKRREYFDTEKSIEKVFANFDQSKKSDNKVQEESKFIITSEMSLLNRTHARLADEATESIDTTLPLFFRRWSLQRDFSYFLEAIKRGVKIRIILKKKNAIQRNDLALPSGLLELRYSNSSESLFGMHIFDKKQVTIAISESKLPSLWTNSIHIVQLASAYFEDTWENAAHV
jgi:sugar-specific transcriptional regulator TrmB